MNKSRRYIYIITIIYAVAIVLTVFSFIGLGFSDSLFRFIISLSAVLLAESVIYGYCIFGSERQVAFSRLRLFLSAAQSLRESMQPSYLYRYYSSIGCWSYPPCGTQPINC